MPRSIRRAWNMAALNPLVQRFDQNFARNGFD